MSKIGFVLANIITEEFATTDKVFDANSNEELKVNFGISFGLNQKEKFLACFVELQYYLGEDLILILKLTTEFKIEPKSWRELKDLKTRKIKFPKEFLRHLGTISVGTTRGVLHTKTENTPYNSIILPLINLTGIIKRDEEFKL